MSELIPETLTVLPNPSLFRAARWMRRVALGVAVAAILIALLPLPGLGAGGTDAAARGAVAILLVGLFSAASLLLSAPGRTGVALSYLQRIVNILVVLAVVLVGSWPRIAASAIRSGHMLLPPVQLSVGFVLLGLAVIIIERKNWLVNGVVDMLAGILCFLSLVLVSNSIFSKLTLFSGRSTRGFAFSLIALATLTVVVTLRQAEHGVFSIFLGVGIGSRLARRFAPVLLLLPFAWAMASAWLSHGNLSTHAAALLASSAVAAAISILLFFAWRMSRMENEIHDLILRDEATRLYNYRGFHMLAEHALRLAQRSGVPFSVLFVDLENLADLRKQLGPKSAAAALAESGEILRTTFRESDIKGRIGGNEFAVAGQFDRAGISVAALRLEATTAARSARNGGQLPLKFSIGHVTTSEANVQESLKDLLYRASQLRNRLDTKLDEMHVN